jgi:hypothetical protein
VGIAGSPEGRSSGLFLLWGKQKGARPGGPRFHPLVWHALDAAAVVERLWDDFVPVDRSRCCRHSVVSCH